MEDEMEKKKDPDGTGDPLVDAVKVQGTPRGKATCPTADEDMETQVSLSVKITEKKSEEEQEVLAGSGSDFREGWRERKKRRRREKKKAEREARTGISPLHRKCAPELGAGSSAGERRGRELVNQAIQSHAGGPSGGEGRAEATPLRGSVQDRPKRRRESNTGTTPEMRPARRQKQGTDERTYAQAARRQAAIVARGGGYLTRQQADIIRGRLQESVRRFHLEQAHAKPMAQPRVFLRFRDAGWVLPGFLLVTCHDQFTEDWLARWNPGELEGEPLEVALGNSIPWPRKICVMVKNEVEPDPEAVRHDIGIQNEVQAEAWKAQGVEEVKDNEGDEVRRRWVITYMIPATALTKLQEQNMEVFYELIAMRVFRPRGRRGRTYLAGPKDGGRTQTETGESTSDSESS